MDFHLTVRETDDISVVLLAGELDLATREELINGVQHLIAAGRRRLRLELDGLTFCDSSGLSALLRTRQECIDADVAVQATGSVGQVAEVLRLTGLRDYLENET